MGEGGDAGSGTGAAQVNGLRSFSRWKQRTLAEWAGNRAEECRGQASGRACTRGLAAAGRLTTSVGSARTSRRIRPAVSTCARPTGTHTRAHRRRDRARPELVSPRDPAWESSDTRSLPRAKSDSSSPPLALRLRLAHHCEQRESNRRRTNHVEATRTRQLVGLSSAGMGDGSSTARKFETLVGRLRSHQRQMNGTQEGSDNQD